MVDSLSTTYTERVVSVNERGLKLAGHDDWCNVSKFAVGVVLPQKGQTVSVTLDNKGFIRAISMPDGSPLAPATNGAHSASSVDSRGMTRSDTKDRTITRLAVLKAAAEFGASRQDLKSGDVLRIAESWEAWITREDDHGTVDAF